MDVKLVCQTVGVALRSLKVLYVMDDAV
jgi:hypothetical protein